MCEFTNAHRLDIMIPMSTTPRGRIRRPKPEHEGNHKGLEFRGGLHTSKYDERTIVPTDIVRMQCNVCLQTFTKGVSRLPLDGMGNPIPCPAAHVNPEKGNARCGELDYSIWREMKVVAMPIGRRHNDMSDRGK